ncbi:MAG: hypothetical protein ACRKFN_14655 [Desulfitobacterium sp.]
MKKGLFSQIVLSLLGVAFIFWGSGSLALGISGEQTTAVVTDIRREGGERTDVKPGRYTYNISYTFTLPDGREINGFTKKISDGVYKKADGTSTIQIRYFPGFPYINATDKDTGLRTGPFALILTGGVLVFLMVRKNQRE